MEDNPALLALIGSLQEEVLEYTEFSAIDAMIDTIHTVADDYSVSSSVTTEEVEEDVVVDTTASGFQGMHVAVPIVDVDIVNSRFKGHPLDRD